MAEKDTEGLDETSLELPSLFGRKKKRAAKPAPDPATPSDSPASSEPSAPPAASASTPTTTPVTTPVPGVGTTDEATVATEPVRDPADETVVTEPVRATDPAPTDEPTRTLPRVESSAPATATETTATSGPSATTATSRTVERAPAGGARKAEPARRAKPARTLPSVGAPIAALVVGALIGLLGVGLTWGSLQACDALTGTDSCGGPGLLVVLLVLVVMIVAGSALLRSLGVSEPGGLSFLGVAIFVAVCLVFLLEHLLDPWMVVVGPVLCALGYGTAHWVVNQFNTELLIEDEPEPHDVR